MDTELLTVALGEEEIAHKAAKTGFWEHGFWGQSVDQLDLGQASANWGQVRYRSMSAQRGLEGLDENGPRHGSPLNLLL
jgi:hypothetical protein